MLELLEYLNSNKISFSSSSSIKYDFNQTTLYSLRNVSENEIPIGKF